MSATRAYGYQIAEEDGIEFLVAPCGCPRCDHRVEPGHFACMSSPEDLLALEEEGLRTGEVPLVLRGYNNGVWRWYLTGRSRRDLLFLVRRYAERMPTGVVDPRASEKLAAERAELAEELAAGRWEDALTELADVAYYAGKAVINGLMPLAQAQANIDTAARQCSVEPEFAIIAMRAKYELRAQGVKDKDAERAAVVAAIR